MDSKPPSDLFKATDRNGRTGAKLLISPVLNLEFLYSTIHFSKHCHVIFKFKFQFHL